MKRSHKHSTKTVKISMGDGSRSVSESQKHFAKLFTVRGGHELLVYSWYNDDDILEIKHCTMVKGSRFAGYARMDGNRNERETEAAAIEYMNDFSQAQAEAVFDKLVQDSLLLNPNSPSTRH